MEDFLILINKILSSTSGTIGITTASVIAGIWSLIKFTENWRADVAQFNKDRWEKAGNLVGHSRIRSLVQEINGGHLSNHTASAIILLKDSIQRVDNFPVFKTVLIPKRISPFRRLEKELEHSLEEWFTKVNNYWKHVNNGKKLDKDYFIVTWVYKDIDKYCDEFKLDKKEFQQLSKHDIYGGAKELLPSKLRNKAEQEFEDYWEEVYELSDQIKKQYEHIKWLANRKPYEYLLPHRWKIF